MSVPGSTLHYRSESRSANFRAPIVSALFRTGRLRQLQQVRHSRGKAQQRTDADQPGGRPQFHVEPVTQAGRQGHLQRDGRHPVHPLHGHRQWRAIVVRRTNHEEPRFPEFRPQRRHETRKKDAGRGPRTGELGASSQRCVASLFADFGDVKALDAPIWFFPNLARAIPTNEEKRPAQMSNLAPRTGRFVCQFDDAFRWRTRRRTTSFTQWMRHSCGAREYTRTCQVSERPPARISELRQHRIDLGSLPVC